MSYTSMSMFCGVRAWQRRSSVHDKKDPLAMREAKEEALRLQEAISAALQDNDDLSSDVAPVGIQFSMALFFLFFCPLHSMPPV